jgi:hypothetical protein
MRYLENRRKEKAPVRPARFAYRRQKAFGGQSEGFCLLKERG